MKYFVGDIIPAKVTGINAYGFFVNIDFEYNGLCHISEVSNGFVKSILDYVTEGEDIYVEVLEVDRKHHQMKVSIKDINYKIHATSKLVESRKGFLPLKRMLPKWIDEKIAEYEKQT